jgi:hypothetical protein
VPDTETGSPGFAFVVDVRNLHCPGGYLPAGFGHLGFGGAALAEVALNARPAHTSAAAAVAAARRRSMTNSFGPKRVATECSGLVAGVLIERT